MSLSPLNWPEIRAVKYESPEAAEAAIARMQAWQKAFDAMREALRIAEDGLQVAVEMHGANFDQTLPIVRAALALADKVSQ